MITLKSLKFPRKGKLIVAGLALAVAVVAVLFHGGTATTVLANEEPGQPSGLNASSTGEGVSLSWTAPTGGAEVSGYRILRRTSDQKKLSQAVRDTGNTSTSWVDTNVENGKVYIYRIRALSESGRSKLSKQTKVRYQDPDMPQPPGQPTDFAGVSVDRGVQLSWSPPTSGGGPDSYSVVRRVDGEESYTFAASVTETGWMDTDVEGGTKYHYAVMARNAGGFGKPTSVLHVTHDAPRIPSAPELIAAVSKEEGMRVEWSIPEEGDAPVGYEIIRKNLEQDEQTESTQKLVSLSEVTNYIDKDVDQDVTYTYAVKGINDFGTGNQSDSVSVTHRYERKAEQPEQRGESIELDDYEIPKNENSPVAHDDIRSLLLIAYGPAGSDGAMVANIGVSPLVEDTDDTTTDYIINFRIVDENGDFATNCEGTGFGGSVHLTTVTGDVYLHSGAEIECAGEGYLARIEILDGDSNFIGRNDIPFGPPPFWDES